MNTIDRAEAAIRRYTRFDGPFPVNRVFYDVYSDHGEWCYSDRDTAEEAAAAVAECEPHNGAYAVLVSGPCWPLTCS